MTPTHTSYTFAKAITKSDTVNYDGTTWSAQPSQFPVPADAIYIGGAGVVVAVLCDGTTASFTCVAGQVLPVRTIRVNSGSTTATLMIALYQ